MPAKHESPRFIVKVSKQTVGKIDKVKKMSIRHTAFVTTSKGRLDHLKQSLPQIVDLQPAEIVVVDYDCPQGTAAWVHENYPDVTVVKISDAPIFNRCIARNAGVAAAKAEWIFFFDADIIFEKRILNWFAQNALNPMRFYRHKPIEIPKIKDTYGTCLLARSAFNTVGGFDEVITGWGAEDDDLYFRLKGAKILVDYFEEYYFHAIEHSDQDRMTYNTIKNKEDQHRINMVYARIKKLAMATLGVQELPREGRLEIMVQAMKACLLDQGATSQEKGKLSISMAPQFVSQDIEVSTRVTFEFECRPRQK